MTNRKLCGAQRGSRREMVVGTESTERAQVDERRAVSRVTLADLVQQYRLAADHSADIIFILDSENHFVYLNPRGEELLDYRSGELAGKTLENLVAGRIGKGHGGARAAGEQARFEIRKKSGSTLWFEMTTAPIVAGGKTLGWLGVGRDVTAQRHAEHRVLGANRELSAVQVVVAEATQAIDLQATLDATLDEVLEILDVEMGAIFLLRSGTQRLDIVTQRGLSRATLAGLTRRGLRVGEGLVGRVVAAGEPMLLENVTDGSRLTASRNKERKESLVCVPLRAEGKTVGAITVGRHQEDSFTPDEVRILASIGRQVGIVIENARLHEDARRKVRRLALLNQVSHLMGKKTTRAGILSVLVHAATQLIASPVAIVLMLDEANGCLRSVAAQGIASWRDLCISADDPFFARVLVSGEPVTMSESPVETDGLIALKQRMAELSSLTAVSLRVHDKAKGVLLAAHRQAGRHGEEDVELLSCLADQGATALEHTRLDQQAKRHAERSDALNEITKAMVASLDPDRVFRALATQIRRLVDHDRLTIALCDAGARTVEVFALTRDGKSTVAKGTIAKLADLAQGAVVSSGKALIRSNLEKESPFPWDGLLLAWGMRSDAYVPLFSRDTVIGALGVASSEVEKYQAKDIDLLQQVAGQVAVAVENARLHQQTIADLRELTALREVVESISIELDLDSLLHKIIVAAAELVAADNGSVALADEPGNDSLRLRALYNLPANQLGREIAAGEGLLGQVIETKRAVLVHHYGSVAQLRPDSAEDFSSYLAVPIWWQDKLIGTFALGSRDPKRRFATHDCDKLQTLAKHAAIAIENARLYRKSRELAVTEERNRLARDIHDTLAQSLTGIVLQLEAVAGLFKTRPDEAWQELQEARALARRSLDEARQSVWGLHPTPLQNLTIDQAIDRELRGLARQAGLATHFSSKGEPRPLAPDVETAIFRIAQEALSNIRKHAAASAVHAELQFGETEVTLVIEDDGVGLAGSKQAGSTGGGFGLTSMRERARLLGGELRLDSAPGEGTRLSTIIPYQAASPIHVVAPAAAEISIVEPSVAQGIRVLIADDHPIARQGIRRMLESYADIAVVAEAADGVEAVSLTKEHNPDVVLMDLQMPRLNGVGAIEQLRESNPEAKVLIISTYAKDEFLFEGIKAGARGYLLKDVPPEDLAQAVRAVSRGESLLQGVVAGKLLDRLGKLARGEGGEELTDREMAVLMLLASGARNKEIARQLTITEKTVKFHVANIFRKVGAGSRTEALAIALDRGLLRR